jgi:LacI family transcriptional regulator
VAITMLQVAQQAQVSLKTVSRVVNNEAQISAKTREHVLAVIKDMGFVPNLAARRLSQGKAMTLGIVLGWSIDSPYSSALVHHVFIACNQQGYNLMLFSRDQDVSQQVMQAYVSKQVDGIILDTKSSLHTELRRQLNTLQVPYLIIHPSHPDDSMHSTYVTIDDYQSAKEAVLYLIELGHKNIGGIFEKTMLSQETNRLSGYQSALKESGIQFSESWLYISTEQGMRGGFQGASHLIKNNPQLSALFCSTDEIAFGAMNAIWQSGLKIPDDISVLGFDDIKFASMLIPPLTTVQQPTHLIANAAVAQLITMINDPSTEQTSIILPTHLIIRQTTKALEVS